MSLKIVRNDITKMNTEAIVNTANCHPIVGSGCDIAIYKAAGYDELLAYRKNNIGFVEEGNVFITPGFNLSAKYIIHAVSPVYFDGKHSEETKLRSCYKKSLQLAKENNIKSISFPLISTGSFGYPKEEGMRIALDEINSFLFNNDIEIILVVFGSRITGIGKNIYKDLEEYIDNNYVEEAELEEYNPKYLGSNNFSKKDDEVLLSRMKVFEERDDYSNFTRRKKADSLNIKKITTQDKFLPLISKTIEKNSTESLKSSSDGIIPDFKYISDDDEELYIDFEEQHKEKLEDRIKHLSDTYSEYLMYLIEKRNLKNSDVWKRAIVDRKIFSKIKNNVDYHPNKMTALCLCIGAMLNLDESKDLLSRAGYALSPCDKTDIIFTYFIENKIYDMIELDIQLEEHGLPCIIS